MERRISGVSYKCWMDFHNTLLCCGFLCARLISLYFFVSILCLSFRLPRRGLPRPILTTTGYHACVYIPVITPELSRSTTQVHRVITPAISNSYFVVFVVYLSPASTPPVLLLHHHRAPHATTYSTMVPLCGSFIISVTWFQRKCVYTPYGDQCCFTMFPICENPTKRGVWALSDA